MIVDSSRIAVLPENKGIESGLDLLESPVPVEDVGSRPLAC